MAQIVTFVSYVSNGLDLIYSVPFEYLSKTHVYVTFDGVPTTDYVWLSTHSIRFNNTVVSGVHINIERRTPYDEPQIVWQDGSVLIAYDMNVQQLQNLFVLQENLYRLATVETKIDTTLNTALQAEEALRQYSVVAPVPFGRFYVGSDGYLKLLVYGAETPDNIGINSDGDLIMTVPDIT